MVDKTGDVTWLMTLQRYVEAKPCVILRIDKADSDSLAASRLGFNEFTLALSHALLSDITPPVVCLIFGSRMDRTNTGASAPVAFFGIVSSRSAITTLETRIKVKRALSIEPKTEKDLIKALGRGTHASLLGKKLASDLPVTILTPMLSSALIAALATVGGNVGAMRAIAESLHAPRRYNSVAALQEDAVQTALRAFGLSANDRAEVVELVEGRSTALARLPTTEDALDEFPMAPSVRMLQAPRIPLIEDSVVEHDARSVPGYDMISSDSTGRALFKKGVEKLQVFTANRRDLEHVFGVDLIYLNLTKKNIVMVQYKMLEPNRRKGRPTDWLYRPEESMQKEIERMKAFGAQHAPGPLEYRLNPQVFYMKFVKRDGALSSGGIVTPIDHYEKLLRDPASKGARGAVRVSYESLGGRYLRQSAFVDLIQSGYIGANAETTDYLDTLVQAVLDGNRAVVMAVQSSINGHARDENGE